MRWAGCRRTPRSHPAGLPLQPSPTWKRRWASFSLQGWRPRWLASSRAAEQEWCGSTHHRSPHRMGRAVPALDTSQALLCSPGAAQCITVSWPALGFRDCKLPLDVSMDVLVPLSASAVLAMVWATDNGPGQRRILELDASNFGSYVRVNEFLR